MSAAPVGGDYALTAHTGERVTNRSFTDRYTLFFFGFTHCKVVCPETLGKLSDAIDLAEIPRQALQPLYVTVDPDRDTPSRMREFLEARFPRFLGLTGTPEEIENIKRLFKVFAEKRVSPDNPADYDMPHSAYAFLMASDGTCAAYFTSVDTVEEIAAMLRARIN